MANACVNVCIVMLFSWFLAQLSVSLCVLIRVAQIITATHRDL